MKILKKKSTTYSGESKTYKKASVLDVIGLIMIPLILLIIIVSAGTMYQEVATQLRTTTDRLHGTDNFEALNVSLTELEETTNKFPAYWDFLFLALILGMWLVIAISSFLLGNHPVFIVVYVLISIASIIVGFGVSNALTEVSEDSFFSAFLVNFPLTSWYITNSIYFNLFFIVSIGLLLYLKLQGSK